MRQVGSFGVAPCANRAQVPDLPDRIIAATALRLGLPLISRDRKQDGKGGGSRGFYNRATHNLWVLLEEAKLIQKKLSRSSYKNWYTKHLDNTMYRPLIDQLVQGEK